MSLIDHWIFTKRLGGAHGEAGYVLKRTTCCGSVAVEEVELSELYTNPEDLTVGISLLYDPRVEQPPRCPFCGATEWDLVEIEDVSDVPESWQWALVSS